LDAGPAETAIQDQRRDQGEALGHGAATP
jgi:hypothetical protein